MMTVRTAILFLTFSGVALAQNSKPFKLPELHFGDYHQPRFVRPRPIFRHTANQVTVNCPGPWTVDTSPVELNFAHARSVKAFRAREADFICRVKTDNELRYENQYKSDYAAANQLKITFAGAGKP